MALFGLSEASVATLSVLCCFILGNAHGQDTGSDGEVFTGTYLANYVGTYTPDPNSLDWIDITNDPSAQNRICDSCDHCMIVKQVSVSVDSQGTWWSDWCRVSGFETHNKGDWGSVAQSRMKSTTLSGEVSISVPMMSALKAKVGKQVTNSVGWERAWGCTNADGIAHGLWFQENIGWAWQTITEKFTQTGSGWCPRAPATYVWHTQVNWPDPRKTGFREFQYHCDWDVKGGRTCNFDSKNHL